MAVAKETPIDDAGRLQRQKGGAMFRAALDGSLADVADGLQPVGQATG